MRGESFILALKRHSYFKDLDGAAARDYGISWSDIPIAMGRLHHDISKSQRLVFEYMFLKYQAAKYHFEIALADITRCCGAFRDCSASKVIPSHFIPPPPFHPPLFPCLRKVCRPVLYRRTSNCSPVVAHSCTSPKPPLLAFYGGRGFCSK